MRCIAACTIILAAVGAAAAAPGFGQGLTLGGSLLVQPVGWYTTSLSYGSTSTLGLDFTAGGGRARAEASLEAAVLTGQSAVLAWLIAASPYGRPDELLVPAIPDPQDVVVAARVRTMYAKLDFDAASLTLGRQVINYGRGTLWSPTDIFTELDLSGISPVRRGTDALRFMVPFAPTAGLDLVGAPTLAPADGRYAARLNALIANALDAAVVGARDGTAKAWLLGADFKVDVEVGLTGAAIYDWPDSGGPGFLRAAAGLDWSIGDVILAVEYYYNGGGGAGDLLFPGMHNGYASVTWNVSQLAALSFSVVADLQAQTGTGTFLVRASAAQNANVTVFLQAGNGSAGYGVGYGVGGSSWIAQAGLGLEVKF